MRLIAVPRSFRRVAGIFEIAKTEGGGGGGGTESNWCRKNLSLCRPADRNLSLPTLSSLYPWSTIVKVRRRGTQMLG